MWLAMAGAMQHRDDAEDADLSFLVKCGEICNKSASTHEIVSNPAIVPAIGFDSPAGMPLPPLPETRFRTSDVLQHLNALSDEEALRFLRQAAHHRRSLFDTLFTELLEENQAPPSTIW